MEIYCYHCKEPLPWDTILVPMVKGNYFCVDCFRDRLVNEKTKDMNKETAEEFIVDLEELDNEELVKGHAEEWVSYDSEIGWLEDLEKFQDIEAKSGYFEKI